MQKKEWVYSEKLLLGLSHFFQKISITMRKTIIYISIILWVSNITFLLHADETMSCEYVWKFNQCKVANQNGASRTIEDFVCISSNKDEDILDQIILDIEFRKIDDEIEGFLDSLDQDKEASATDSNTVINDIATNLLPEWIYYRQFKSLCNWWLLAKRAECTWSIPNITAGNRLANPWWESDCMALVENKLNIYSQVAYDIIKINKSDVREDRLQEWVVQKIRTKYDELIDIMTTIIWNIWRLARWITHWTPDPK